MTRHLTRLAVAAALALAVPVGSAASVGAATPSASSTAHVAPQPAAPRIACAVVRHAGAPAVRCRWTTVQDRRVAGYVVYRARLQPSMTGREPIARVRQGDRPAVLDTRVRPGTVMAYAVVAVDRSGAPLRVGNIVRVKIPSGS